MSKRPSPHGAGVRGYELPRRSRTFEGRFGRMFRNLAPAKFKESNLLKLGKKMISRGRLYAEDERNPEESTIPAGYTYLGQFIDHDLTFDPVSSLQRDNDPEALVNYRTPRFDLDCVYGRGPADQPFLYQQDGIRMLLGNLLKNKTSPDLPRVSTERAVIGDARNDENVIISQLHGIFLRFHNKRADELKKRKPDFATVQRSVRWHYQWVVLHDFLRRLVNKETYDEVLPHVAKHSDPHRHPPNLLFYRARGTGFIPIEFSAAAYRFGHSMVRRRYRLNRTAAGGPFEILGSSVPQEDLRGFGLFSPEWAIEWDLFFDGIATTAQKPFTKDRVQPAHKIDTSLAKPLGRLPFTRDRRPSLARRNLTRGWRFNLPSGQAVSHAMGKKPLPDRVLTVLTPGVSRPLRLLTDISSEFKENAPLWFYVLAEANHLFQGNQLGPVGGRIVMETFVGLMMADGYSFLRQDPLWKPDGLKKGRKFGMAEFIKKAIAP